MDPKTIAFYDAQAANYEALVRHETKDPILLAFIDALPQGASVLDLGCGPGHAAAVFARAGCSVTATDASAVMVAMAAERPGVTARQATFDQITGEDLYDGIWANFSLLHAPRADMPRHLAALKTALKPGGLFHVALKTGAGEKRDTIERLYTYYGIDELRGLLTAAGFTVTETRTGESMGCDGTVAPWVAMTAHG